MSKKRLHMNEPNSSPKGNGYRFVFWGVVLISLTVAVVAWTRGGTTNAATYGLFGDFFGGTIVTIVSVFAAIFVLEAFNQQIAANNLLKRQYKEDSDRDIQLRHAELLDRAIDRLRDDLESLGKGHAGGPDTVQALKRFLE